MPKIRRDNFAEHLLRHLLARMRERQISPEQIVLLSNRLETEPEVPNGKWFKKFPGMTVCGEGELVKTFLQPHQAATGQAIKQAEGCDLRLSFFFPAKFPLPFLHFAL